MDNTIKIMQDLNSERQSIFDNLMKAYDARLKLLVDAHDKMEKAVDAANADLDKANKDMDAAETEIRKCIRSYYATALDMNKKDMADAVNKLVTESGK